MCVCVFLLGCICCCSAELKRMNHSLFLICSHCSTYCLFGMRMRMAMCNIHCVCICVCIFAPICICVFVFVFVFVFLPLYVFVYLYLCLVWFAVVAALQLKADRATSHSSSVLIAQPIACREWGWQCVFVFLPQCGIVFVKWCLNCSCCWWSAIQNQSSSAFTLLPLFVFPVVPQADTQNFYPILTSTRSLCTIIEVYFLM